MENVVRALVDTPQKGFDLHTEMACYSLPYGGLGFTSHILTYYTLFCLCNGVSPFWPVRQVRYSKFDLILSSIGLTTSSAMAIYTLVKCRNSWQLLTIGVWKLSVSLMNGTNSLNVAVLVFRARSKAERRAKAAALEAEEGPSEKVGNSSKPSAYFTMPNLNATYYWIYLCVPDAHKVLGLTIGFYGIMGLSFVGGLVLVIAEGKGPFTTLFTILGTVVLVFSMVGPFYADWMLGVLVGNLAGLPTKDNAAFYWTYFIAKRLTMFSW
ncbi:hypothetical protein BDN72DRAFT_960505 [Pluteus cervinus]|uniref:Uncharacterized protein n=1 Tax=Pluteus cervinus TaxID=181527 RepID=A0ACD3AS92_9AGAR|nr:hypothetical protein BDN72DRAFT_960505 [Pluteus cervinus]